MCKLFGDTVCFTNGEEAQLLRLSLMQLFRGKAVDTYADYVNRVCIRNLKELSLSSEPVAVYTLFKRLATELVLGIFLNVDAEESAALSKQITQLSTQHWHGLISAPVKVKVSVWSSAFTQALEAKEKLLNIINERLKSEEDGLIAKIRTVPFPENTNAAQHLLLFISALIPKALASLLTSFTVELAGSDKVDLRKRAQESEDYLDHVLLEVERLWPSFIGGRRIAKQDTTLCGYVVPKGYVALFVAFAVHRDPEIFDDPDEFQPERWSGRNAGQEKLLCCFGNGSRNCIGIDLNNMILKTTAGYLLNHYCWQLDPPNQSLEYKWLPVSRPAEDPKIKFTSCSSKT
ncbi:beta-amyrin 11-oxidase-like isoform X2 [Rhincodon typus]|uniref:beta-amyrin 11-oxidase-like isoform X2 n=1 Tax=Rhincodon typus TaxID=259920 RepID=UPI00202E2CDF|nr:beta-amyrin 11-oxidase-like isoform X2 [Rhincodon typus]